MHCNNTIKKQIFYPKRLLSLTIGYNNNVFESHLVSFFSNRYPLTLLAKLVETGPIGQLTVG